MVVVEEEDSGAVEVAVPMIVVVVDLLVCRKGDLELSLRCDLTESEIWTWNYGGGTGPVRLRRSSRVVDIGLSEKALSSTDRRQTIPRDCWSSNSQQPVIHRILYTGWVEGM